jgi:hypothetical protein
MSKILSSIFILSFGCITYLLLVALGCIMLKCTKVCCLPCVSTEHNAMVLETLEALAFWRLKLLVNAKDTDTEELHKNKVIGIYTKHALEDFDFIFDRLSIKLSDIEKQEFIFLLFDTVACTADNAEMQHIDCTKIYTQKSITLPIRTDEISIVSKWLYRHITAPEQYLMTITQAYHVYSITYYTIALLPNFQHRLGKPTSLHNIYFATITDDIRKEIFKFYYNQIIKNAQDTSLVQDFFITYAKWAFAKLLYIFTMASDFEDIEEARAYIGYVRTILQNMQQKCSVKQV